MRRTILALAALAVSAATQLVAQPSHPHPAPPLVDLLAPHAHAKPASRNAGNTPAVVLDAGSLGSPLQLQKGWRVGITANPAAATPGFDDSSWALRDAQEAIPEVPDEDHPEDAPDSDAQSGRHPAQPAGHHRPWVWFRLHLSLAPNHGPLALLVELPTSTTASITFGSAEIPVDVFANGVQIQPEGPNANAPERYQQISRIYNLNVPPAETSLTLAIRTMYIPFGFGSYTSFFRARKLHLGHREDLDRAIEVWYNHNLFERLPRLVNGILLLVLALFLLVLYFTQKGHVEYLWLALHELFLAPSAFVEMAGASALVDNLLFAAIELQLIVFAAYLYFEFLIAFLALRRRWYILLLRYTAPVMLTVAPTLLLVGHSNAIGLLLVAVLSLTALWLLGWLLFCFLTLIVATSRRNFEAGLLLIPLVLSLIGIFEPLLTASMTAMGSSMYRSPLTLLLGPIPIHFASIADFTGILAIVIIIFSRFLRVQRDQERVSSELAAARSVQELMIPQEKIQTPGFEVESIYNPANEVGGDFFHVQPTPDGGLLVILGDVAGKGLKAAMNVSMLMGALRRTPDRSPAKILESLNRVLTGSESFTTCQAVWFGPGGELVLANAGHLPPYLNSQEIALPGGLPLGVLPEVSYEEVHLYMHPGDRLLLLSDGVVEARKPSGELFGFDRVHNLSNQTAFYIADAAREFGQEDDITVLTVRRLAEAIAA